MELNAIVDLGKTESTQNLIRNFFLAEKYKKGASRMPSERVVHAAVIGAGVMGSAIAQWVSSRGVTVILRDIAREQIDRGLANIERIYADAVKRGLMTEEKAKEGRARIVASTAPMELRDVQFVIEAASEQIEITGSSASDLEAAMRGAVTKASETVRNLDWFELTNVRGHIEDGQIAAFSPDEGEGRRVPAISSRQERLGQPRGSRRIAPLRRPSA